MAAVGTTSSATPVDIGAGGADAVVLRNLLVTRAGSSNAARGIQFNSGSALDVEGCVVSGFPGAGLRFVQTGFDSDGRNPCLFVNGTVVRGNGVGVFLDTAGASFKHSRMENNAKGVYAAARPSRLSETDLLFVIHFTSDAGARVRWSA